MTDDKAQLREAVGQRIRWAREHYYPNRSDFSRALDVDVSTVRKIEDGQRSPSIHMLERICHSLGVSRDYVMHGQLHGVNKELASRLIKDHPELVRASGRRDNQAARKVSLQNKEILAEALAHKLVELLADI